MSDLILVECPNCDGGRLVSGFRRIGQNVFRHEACPECEGVGWVLVEGELINLEDLERMAPWADAPIGRPLESGEIGLWPAEIQYVDGIPVGRM